ncbi:DUF5666 domain-containing protein [Roseomonas harenae]|uniref:DUF5666 domain-containing protein n=1 Tax=Muricoccus harenae TaxID=2692566 RepID=UPI00133155C9|nr:DUF5666 domain-containing protein [Roseomonas harenae]
MRRLLPPGVCAPLPAAIALLAACSADPGPAPVAASPAPGLCRIGPDGGPPLILAEGERGIGGTGAPATTLAQAAADTADGERGIGGTGIVGVVTGFASICVNGLHIAYNPALPVAFADGPATPAALRVGQVVVVQAFGPEQALRARRIAVRHELAGPIEAVDETGLRIAGQRVTTAALPAGRAWRVGEQVMVSGLRAPDGSLTATRIDPRPSAGATTIFGSLSRRGGAPWIGDLPLRPVPGLALPPAGPVLARGRMEDGALVADSVEPDRLMRDPPAYLGTTRVLLEAQVGFDGRRLLLGPGLALPAGAGMGPAAAGRRVVELRGGPGAPLSATGLRNGGEPGPADAARGSGLETGREGGSGAASGNGLPLTPRGAAAGDRAPMPDRSFETRRGEERDASGRWRNMQSPPATGRAGQALRSREGAASDGRLNGTAPDGSRPEGGPMSSGRGR